MTRQEFDNGMIRLNNVWRDAFFGERVKILWDEIKSIRNDVWQRCVDSVIREFRHAPTVAQVLTALEDAKMYSRKYEKVLLKQEAIDFWSGTYHKDEIKFVIENIRARLSGQMNDAAYQSFLKTLSDTADSLCDPDLKLNCCDGSGNIFFDENGYLFVAKCHNH